jgi:hypothetical protein
LLLEGFFVSLHCPATQNFPQPQLEPPQEHSEEIAAVSVVPPQAQICIKRKSLKVKNYYVFAKILSKYFYTLHILPRHLRINGTILL